MQHIRIWDIPTRLFHWLLVAGLIGAFCIAQFGGKRGAAFPYHAMIGLVLAAMVLLRIVWGFIGTRYARFGSFLFPPGAVVDYLKGIKTGDPVKHAGHNPASSYAIFLMLALVLAIVGSGLGKAYDIEALGEVHEATVYALLAVAGVHVLGVLLHTLRHKENLTLSMVSGKKLVPDGATPVSGASIAAVGFVLLIGLLGAGFYRNYNASTGKTSLPGLNAAIPLVEVKPDRIKMRKDRNDDD